MSDDTVLQVSTSRRVAPLTLDSPANRNALSRAMRAQRRTALADDAVRVVVLDHTGRVFCSGMDLTEAAGGAAGDQGVRELPELLETVWRSPSRWSSSSAGRRGPAGWDWRLPAASWAQRARRPSPSPRCGWASCPRSSPPSSCRACCRTPRTG